MRIVQRYDDVRKDMGGESARKLAAGVIDVNAQGAGAGRQLHQSGRIDQALELLRQAGQAAASLAAGLQAIRRRAEEALHSVNL